MQTEQPQYEICDINYRIRTKTNIMNGFGKAIFVASVVGPKGSYIAGESSTIELQRDNSPWIDGNVEDKRYLVCLEALETLTQELIASGWEYQGSYGEQTWKRRFRRKI